MKRLLLFISFASSLFTFVVTAQAQNQTVANGTATAKVTFPFTGCTYNWVNNNPSIGLAASGIGNIPSFTAVNTSASPVTATITATPQSIGYAYVPDYSANTVTVVNTTTNAIVTKISVGNQPQGVSVSPDGTRVYITNWASGSVSVINTATNTVIATIPIAGGGWGLVVSPDGSRVYVANSTNNTVCVINTSTNTVIATVPVGFKPVGMAISPDGNSIYVANSGSTYISVINAATNTATSNFPIANQSWALALSPDGSKLYSADVYTDEISVINTATGTVLANIGWSSPDGLVVSPDGSRLYVASLAVGVEVFDTATNLPIQTIAPFDRASAVSIDPDGRTLYAMDMDQINLFVINTVNNTIIADLQIGSGMNRQYIGNFIRGNATCTGTAVTFTITVDPTPNITIGPVTGTNLACTGMPSASPNIQQFTVSGSNLLGDITVTPAAGSGFEVSLSPNGVYLNQIILSATGGVVPGTVIYARMSQSVPGNISGNIVVSSTGVASQNAAVTGTIYQLPDVNTLSNQTVVNGHTTAAVNFTGTADTFNWLNDTPGIGLAASGTGNIPSFTAVNTGAAPVVATITVLPFSSVTGCAGVPVKFTITVQSSLRPTINTSGNLSALSTTYGTASSSTSFTVSGTYMSAGILVTPPSGFEVSLDNIAFGPTVNVGNSGTISATLVYIRLASGTASGNYSGIMLLSSIGATNVNTPNITGEVLPAALTITADNKTKTYRTANPVLTATYQGFVNNDTPVQLTVQPLISTTATTTSPPGLYYITANGALSSNYNISYVQGILTVNPLQQIVIPSAITPNGDGINDVWNINNLQSYPGCTVEVDNRYGQIVYRSTGYNKPWDGTSNGKSLPVGTYYYVINLNNGNLPLSGYVEIIR